MKSLFLLLCASIVCIASCDTEFYPLLINTQSHSQGQSESHRIHKRQGMVNCNLVVFDELCISGYYQGVVNAYQRCNNSESASLTQDRCTPNSMGGYCTLDFTTILCATVNSTCSQECRNTLNLIRNEQGCCIKSVYNESSTPRFYNPTTYAYSLWSGCGVETITQECPPSTVTISPSPVDPTCNNNQAATLQLILSTVCKRQHREAVLNRLLSTEGCQNFSSSSTEFSICSSNRFGTYCRVLLSATRTLFTEASESCHNTSTCDPGCIANLNNIINTVGCCLNDEYNTTSTSQDWLSYEFWSMCNLTSPGLCELRLSDDELSTTEEPFTNATYSFTTLQSETTSTDTSMNATNNLVTTPQLEPLTADSSLGIILSIVGAICSVLLVVTTITIAVICALKVISKRKLETSSQHNEQKLRGEEVYQEEHVYDYIKEADEDPQMKENAAYGMVV